MESQALASTQNSERFIFQTLFWLETRISGFAAGGKSRPSWRRNIALITRVWALEYKDESVTIM